MKKTLFSSPDANRLSVTVGDRFTVCVAPEGEVCIHPKPFHLGDGRMLMTVNRDRDIADAEYAVLASDDLGESWREERGWPAGDGSGRHVQTVALRLPDGDLLAVWPHLSATKQPGKYLLATWRSSDAGTSWDDVEGAPVDIPTTAALDIYEPPDWYLRRHTGEKADPYIKPEPPRIYCEQLFPKFGRMRLPGQLTHFHLLDDGTILALIYTTPSPVRLFSSFCLQSSNGGRSWTTRSIPGPCSPDYEAKNRHKKPLDGLCESAVAGLPDGRLITVMRIGAWQPLHAVWSEDEGHTWTPPRPIPVFGILPTLEMLPGGILALATGRPDNTLSFSFDGGESWPWTLRLFDQTNPLHPSTRNNGMIQVSPGRLLYLYDTGYRRPDPEVEVPHAVEGQFIEVSTRQ